MQPFLQLFRSATSFLYPSKCLCCKEEIPEKLRTLCMRCQEELTLLSCEGRCGFCFREKEGRRCRSCTGKLLFCDYKAACFEMHPVVRCLLSGLKEQKPYLVDSLAAMLLLQHQALLWPLPDVITYVPRYAAIAGSPPAQLLAGKLALFMKRPVISSLKKVHPTLKQQNVSLEQREQLALDTFAVKKAAAVDDKTVLIIDDYMTTGRTLDCASFALLEKNPKRIYGLTLAIE